MQIRTGLKGLRIAKIISDKSAAMTGGEPKVEYDEVKHLLNVQNIDLTAKTQTTDVDSDDCTDVLSKCTGYDGKAQRTMFSPAEQAMLLDETLTEDGIYVSTEKDDPAEFATGFMTPLNDGKILAVWLLRTKYSTSDFSAETAGTEKLNPQSDTMSFKSMARRADGVWRIYGVFDTEKEADAFLTVEKINKIYAKETTSTPTVNTGDTVPKE